MDPQEEIVRIEKTLERPCEVAASTLSRMLAGNKAKVMDV